MRLEYLHIATDNLILSNYASIFRVCVTRSYNQRYVRNARARVANIASNTYYNTTCSREYVQRESKRERKEEREKEHELSPTP